MTELIEKIFTAIFGNNSGLATFFVSMIPLMELKGGIPFGMSEAFWGKNALSQWKSFWIAYLGCFVVVIILYFLFKPIMALLKKTKIFKGIANYIDNRVKKETVKLEQKTDEQIKESNNESEQLQGDLLSVNNGKTNLLARKTFLKMLGVFAFVAIPLPLTGVWMGTCIAVMVNLNFWQTMLAVQLGNFCAGLIISTVCVIFPNFTHILIYIFVVLIVLVFIFELIKNLVKKNKKNRL